jgi:hypothetical protein
MSAIPCAICGRKTTVTGTSAAGVDLLECPNGHKTCDFANYVPPLPAKEDR